MILLDWRLPDGSGVDWLRQLRSGHGENQHTPVLLLTARDSLNDRIEGLDAGADDYLIKPFQLAELAARIRATSRRAAGHATGILTIGEIALERAGQAVTLKGAPVDLTAREYALLEALMRRAGRILSRTTLEELLYGFEADVVQQHRGSARRQPAPQAGARRHRDGARHGIPDEGLTRMSGANAPSIQTRLLRRTLATVLLWSVDQRDRRGLRRELPGAHVDGVRAGGSRAGARRPCRARGGSRGDIARARLAGATARGGPAVAAARFDRPPRRPIAQRAGRAVARGAARRRAPARRRPRRLHDPGAGPLASGRGAPGRVASRAVHGSGGGRRNGARPGTRGLRDPRLGHPAGTSSDRGLRAGDRVDRPGHRCTCRPRSCPAANWFAPTANWAPCWAGCRRS